MKIFYLRRNLYMMKIFFMVNLVASILAINLCKSILKKRATRILQQLAFGAGGSNKYIS